MKHAVGIDPSFSGCAVVAIDEKGRHVAKSFAAGSRGSAPRARVARCNELAEKVVDLLDGLEIAALAIEGYAMASGSTNSTGFLDLIEFGGLLRADLCTLGEFPIWEVSPPTLKVFVTGRGNTSGPRKVTKGDMLEGVFDLWGVQFGDHNLADAYGLAALAAQAAGLFRPKNNRQSEAIQTVTGREVRPEKCVQSMA